MKYPLYLFLLLASACGDDGTTPDAGPTISISGTASQRTPSGSEVVGGVTVAAYAKSDENTPLAMATTDANGNYTLTVPAGGGALDGYIKATMSGLVDTYLYPPGPIAADYSDAALNMLASGTLDLLANTLCRANQDTAMGVIAVEVVDASMTAVQGATVTSDPAATSYCYNMGALPSASATSTDTDGIAYMFNVTNDVNVNAMKSGSTFTSHSVKARAGALTTTLITP